jgi:hypothetical protein
MAACWRALAVAVLLLAVAGSGDAVAHNPRNPNSDADLLPTWEGMVAEPRSMQSRLSQMKVRGQVVSELVSEFLPEPIAGVSPRPTRRPA